MFLQFLDYIRKFPICVYTRGVLTHANTWNQHWVGYETLKLQVHFLPFVQIVDPALNLIYFLNDEELINVSPLQKG